MDSAHKVSIRGCQCHCHVTTPVKCPHIQHITLVSSSKAHFCLILGKFGKLPMKIVVSSSSAGLVLFALVDLLCNLMEFFTRLSVYHWWCWRWLIPAYYSCPSCDTPLWWLEVWNFWRIRLGCRLLSTTILHQPRKRKWQSGMSSDALVPAPWSVIAL